MRPSPEHVTELLQAGNSGDKEALNKLLPLVYDELRRLADHYMRGERVGHTLQPTALVHEAYVRLVGWQDVKWQNRAHFFGVAAQMMRNILVNHAKSRGAAKRGGAAQRLTLDESLAFAEQRDVNLLALDDALTRLEALDPQKGRIVELRYFSGLSVEETAEVLGVSAPTVKRQWRAAKAWLYREISGSAQNDA